MLWIQPLGMPVCCLHPPSLLQLTHTCLSPPLPHGFTAPFFLKAKQIDSCLALLGSSMPLPSPTPACAAQPGVLPWCSAQLPALHWLSGSPCTAWPASRPWVALGLLTLTVGAAECFRVSESSPSQPCTSCEEWLVAPKSPGTQAWAESALCRDLSMAVGSPVELGSGLAVLQ